MIDHSAVSPVLDLDTPRSSPLPGAVLSPMADDQRHAQLAALAESLSFAHGS